MSRVLIVEDQPAVGTALALLLEVHGIESEIVRGPDEALLRADREEFGAAIQDMNFTPGTTSGAEGVDLFRRLRALDPGLPILLVTAWTSLETAVQLVKEGAADYMAKPWDDAKLVAAVRTMMRLRALQLENERLKRDARRAREALSAGHDLCGLVYAGAAMHRVASLAVQVAASDLPVLITGPNGAGKEKIADIVHANSRRARRPLVKVNAGALPNELLEAELFGAEPGAYTGATKRRVGRFEAADGGTLFLDEIGTLSPQGQVKLLRVLQDGAFERLGSSESRRVDVRLIAATNADLRRAIAEGRFREDLLFRINVIELRVPALAERPDDILPLAEHFAGPRPLSAAARRALQEHPWPGNVRELQNRIQRAALLGQDAEISAADLGFGDDEDAGAPAAARDAPRDAALEEERRELQRVLLDSGGMVSRAAERLGVSRQALYRRMEKLGVVLERRPRP